MGKGWADRPPPVVTRKWYGSSTEIRARPPPVVYIELSPS